MTPAEILLLFAAGLLGGALNAVAGGGSFVTFPALLSVGVPAVPANATNTLAALPGYLTSLWAYRAELARRRALVARILLYSFAGGLIGAALLLSLPAELFRQMIPWLLAFATLAFAAGPTISARLAAGQPDALGVHPVGHLLVAAYGGFFNAGLGILILGLLRLEGHEDVNEMNALKMLTSSAVAAIAVIAFFVGGLIAWTPGLAVVAGTAAGGYGAARLARHLPQHVLRDGIIIYAAALTLYWYWRIYGSG